MNLTTGDVLATLHRWIAEGRVDDAARARARQHWLERQATEDATMAGVLLDLAERSRPITITTAAGQRLTGPVVAMGANFTVLRDPRVGDTFVPLDQVGVVRTAPGDRLPLGDRALTLAATLGTALAELAAGRPDVIVGAPGEKVRGELQSVGADMVTVALDRARRDRVHIHLPTIDHVVILGN